MLKIFLINKMNKDIRAYENIKKIATGKEINIQLAVC